MAKLIKRLDVEVSGILNESKIIPFVKRAKFSSLVFVHKTVEIGNESRDKIC